MVTTTPRDYDADMQRWLHLAVQSIAPFELSRASYFYRVRSHPPLYHMYIDGHTCIYNDVHDRQFQHVVEPEQERRDLRIKKEHGCDAVVYTLQFHLRARNELTIPYAPHSAASQ